MKKEDIEKIVNMSYPYLKEKARNLSLIDMYDVSCNVWNDIKNIKEEAEKEYFVINSYELKRFKQKGNMWFTTKEGLEIEWMYSPYFYRLESGGSLPYCNLPKEKKEELTSFFEANVEGQPTALQLDVSLSLLDKRQKDVDMTGWILHHLDALRDVVDFEIRDVKTAETIKELVDFLEDIDVDIFGRDSNGNILLITGDRHQSTHWGLIRLISTAIMIDAKKAIYVANEIQTYHQIIIKWLNEYFSHRIGFYLVEAKRIVTNKQIPVATCFELIESPSNGWINHPK
jgi:hypothetical protein